MLVGGTPTSDLPAFHQFFVFLCLPSARWLLLPDMDEILQRLTEVSIRQQQITEHLAA